MTRSNVRRSARSIGISVVILAAGRASIAQAEPSDADSALATTLFNDAKSLLTEGKIADACRKLEESWRLDPLPGTLLNLAACHEKEGLFASALAEFREARAFAERDKRADRVAFADQHLTAIAPKVSALVIAVPGGVVADLAELQITHDGAVLPRAEWSQRIPVNPGDHVVEAFAPGKRPMRRVVAIGAEADVQTVVIAFENDGRIEVVPMKPVQNAPTQDAPTNSNESGLSPRRMFAITTASVGVVGVGLGTFFGLRTIDKHNDPEATCTTTPCSSRSISLNDQAKFAGDASTVSFVVGLAALAGAAFLWFGDNRNNATKVSVTPFGLATPF